MVGDVSLCVLVDVSADQPDLAVAEVGVGLAERDASVAQRLHLGPGQLHAGLEPVEQVVVVPRAAILSDQLLALSSHRSSLGGGQLDLAGGLVDRLDSDRDRITEPERAAAAAADQGRAEVIELEVIAGEASSRQEAFEDLAEAGEETGADHADYLALEGLVPAAFVELGVEQPRQADVVGAVLDIGRRPLAL